MESLNPATEWLRLSEHYRQISDDELLGLARQDSELTEVAQQALKDEIHQRRLKLEPEKAPPQPEPQTDSSYAEERELVEVCSVWSLADALQLQTLLDGAGIPFFMGPEKATGVDAVTSNFVNGVSVQVMRIGLPWARQALQHYMPANQPEPKQQEEPGDFAVRCPKCSSEEVIFESLTTQPATTTDSPSPKFEWTCDSCGHQWEDDGVEKEE
jgi:DNA-directed RNA polymerase subunit M/transcription elongation factor TFIIS